MELTKALFSEAKGKDTEENDRVIGELEGMLYGEEKIVSLVDPDAQQFSIGKSPHEQGWLYYFPVESCRDCPYGEDCPTLNEGRVRVFVSEDYQLKILDENLERKEALKIRSSIERRFGGGKKWLGLGRARYRGKAKMVIQALMTFLVMNEKDGYVITE